MAAGCPVIAYKDGGALDYVESNKTGVFFEAQTVDELVQILKHFDSNKFSTDTIQNKAKHFSPDIFKEKLTALIQSKF